MVKLSQEEKIQLDRFLDVRNEIAYDARLGPFDKMTVYERLKRARENKYVDDDEIVEMENMIEPKQAITKNVENKVYQIMFVWPIQYSDV